MKKFRWLLAAFGLVAAGGWAIKARRHPKVVSRTYGAPGLNPYRFPVERRAKPDPGALSALAQGIPSRIGLDLARLKAVKGSNYQPLVEYLGYIQTQRGSSDALVFVREGDLAGLAGLAGKPRDEFVAQFKRLGVVLSMN